MEVDTMRCLLVEANDGEAKSSVVSLPVDRLPAGDVTIRVEYSSLNFKDALAHQGHPGVAKSLPLVPGIDAAGVVIRSDSQRFRAGERVLVTGYELGQGHWGGWAEQIRVPAEWVVPLPEGLSTREAMIWGTAGFTAAQSVLALRRNGVGPEDGELVVTGASGGVGSLSVRILAKLGYDVVAVTGKAELHGALRELGANRVVEREEILNSTSKPLLTARWAGAIDTVGGQMLNSLLRSVRYGGCVTACGLVAGAELSMTVYPFLLRGISLCGIASADCPYDKRVEIWRLLAHEWKPQDLESLLLEVDLEGVSTQVAKILRGEVAGRVLVRP